MTDDNRYERIITSIAGVAAMKVSGVASLSSVSGMAGKKSQKRQPKSVLVTIVGKDIVSIDIYVNAFRGSPFPILPTISNNAFAAKWRVLPGSKSKP